MSIFIYPDAINKLHLETFHIAPEDSRLFSPNYVCFLPLPKQTYPKPKLLLLRAAYSQVTSRGPLICERLPSIILANHTVGTAWLRCWGHYTAQYYQVLQLTIYYVISINTFCCIYCSALEGSTIVANKQTELSLSSDILSSYLMHAHLHSLSFSISCAHARTQNLYLCIYTRGTLPLHIILHLNSISLSPFTHLDR